MFFDYNFGNQFYNYYGDLGVKSIKYKIVAPEQSQEKQPGIESVMVPRPIFDNPNYKGSGKLKDKVAIITGGDSGLGRAAAVAFVKEGAKVVIPYYDEHSDANETKEYIENLGGECLLLSGDISDRGFCKHIVEKTYMAKLFGRPDTNAFNKFKWGMELEGRKTAPAKLEVVEDLGKYCMCKITITEGRNRQVRKMCDLVKHPVATLKRVGTGELELGNLPKGKYRYLTEKEIRYLKNL